jgi:hypothetical protein
MPKAISNKTKSQCGSVIYAGMCPYGHAAAERVRSAISVNMVLTRQHPRSKANGDVLQLLAVFRPLRFPGIAHRAHCLAAIRILARKRAGNFCDDLDE